MEKLTKIVIVFFIAFGLTSCVTKKKLKESQELTTTHILDVTDIRIANLKNTLKGEISESVSQEVTEKFKEQKESSSTNENETTDVTVNITAEDGKEKSATVGNTTVTSNGADVTVKTSSTKATNKQIETLNSEWSQKYDILEKLLKTAEMKSEQRDYANLKRIEQLESKLNKQSKETNKKGLSFWLVIIAIVSAILFIAYKVSSKRLFFNTKKKSF